MLRLGSIDLGSNSMHLQIVDIESDGAAIPVEVLRSSVRLGAGWGDERVEMPAELQEEAISAISGFAARCAIKECDEVICTATAALRDASNSDDFSKRLKAELGLDLQVLTGKMEARLVKEGTRPFLPEGFLLFDLGGRSTEVVTAGLGEHEYSLNVGHLTLAERCDTEDAVGDAGVDAMLEAARGAMAELVDTLTADPHNGIASPSGAVRTLARMAAANRGEEIEGNGTGIEFTVADLDAVITLVSRTPKDELKDLPGIDMRRSSTLLAAGCIVRALMEAAGIASVTAIPGGIREGIIQKWIADHEYRLG